MDFTKISLGEFRILNGRLEEKVLHIQHRKIGEAEPFCKEVFEEIKLTPENLVFEISLSDTLYMLGWNDCRRIMYKHGTYFIDEKGFVCAKVSVFLHGEVVFTKSFVLIGGRRVCGKINSQLC